MFEPITTVEGRLLWYILLHDGALTLDELCQHMGISDDFGEYLIARFVRSGYVIRRSVGYRVDSERCKRVLSWAEHELVAVAKSGKLLFVADGFAVEDSLVGRALLLGGAQTATAKGVLWLGRTSRIAAVGDQVRSVAVSVPQQTIPLIIEACAVRGHLPTATADVASAAKLPSVRLELQLLSELRVRVRKETFDLGLENARGMGGVYDMPTRTWILPVGCVKPEKLTGLGLELVGEAHLR